MNRGPSGVEFGPLLEAKDVRVDEHARVHESLQHCCSSAVTADDEM
jgi:hypothetical protein